MGNLFDFNLTETQQKHLEAIEWLLDFNINIRSGRSYLMAVAFIRMAIRHPKQRVYVYDHFPGQRDKERMLDSVRRIIDGICQGRADETKEQKKEKAEILARFKFGNDWLEYVGTSKKEVWKQRTETEKGGLRPGWPIKFMAEFTGG